MSVELILRGIMAPKENIFYQMKRHEPQGEPATSQCEGAIRDHVKVHCHETVWVEIACSDVFRVEPKSVGANACCFHSEDGNDICEW